VHLNLHDLPPDALTHEIEGLRALVAAISPPRTMLEAHQRDRLMWRLFALQDEQRHRERGPEKKRRGRKPQIVHTHWTTTAERRPTVEDKANREADKRLAHVLAAV